MNDKNSLSEELILNIILKNLNENERAIFFDLLDKNKLDDAENFVLEKIPDLEDKVRNKLKEIFQNDKQS